MLTLAYLGLGANLGDPIQQMVDAREALLGLESTLRIRCSNFYVSSPVGYEAQADFVNCVVELETTSGALELLDDMQAIENAIGRQRVADNQNAPRVIDIDLLLFGDQVIDIERLQVPHPRMKNRLFVLEPLLELANLEPYRIAVEAGDFQGQELARLTIGRY